jgi:aspartate carbamoyltransferase catalytic subunit
VREEAIVMHPGPYNRGVELDDSVLEFAGWRYARQVMHGVSVRMAVLDFLVNGARSLVLP